MVKFFSWGIFTNSSTCKSHYGRDITAKTDTLSDWSKMPAFHKVTPSPGDKLHGVVLELTEKEFQQTEDFERRYGYLSINVTTDSGEKCKFYVTKDILEKYDLLKEVA